MPVVDVKNLKNEVVGQIELSDRVFGVELNKALIYDAVKAFLANRRAGTVSTKTRGEVSGSGRKLWRQKGTGRARVASLRSPLWKGGGSVHGPKPRDWSVKLPKKMRRGAVKSALSERIREGRLTVVEDFNLDSHKTKEFARVLNALGLTSKVLLVDSLENENLVLSSRNLPNVTLTGSEGVNIYDILYHDNLVFSKDAITRLENLLSR